MSTFCLVSKVRDKTECGSQDTTCKSLARIQSGVNQSRKLWCQPDQLLDVQPWWATLKCDDAIGAIMMSCEENHPFQENCLIERVQDIGCVYDLIL